MFAFLECPWFDIPYSFKILMGINMVILGFGGVLLNGWMMISFIYSHLMTYKSDLLILNVIMGCMGRSLLGGFPFAGSSAIAGRWFFGEQCCILFAFMHQLLGVFQMVSISALALERYLLMRRFKYGLDLGIWFYAILIMFCWTYALAFSIPPLLHYGSYTCDITGTVCALDWRSLNLRQLSFNILVVIFGGCVPILVIIFSFAKVISMKKGGHFPVMDDELNSFNESSAAMIGILLMMWTPQGVLSLQTMFIGSSETVRSHGASTFFAIFCPIMSELATMVPVLCFIYSEPRIRTALMGRIKKHYGIIRNRGDRPHFSS